MSAITDTKADERVETAKRIRKKTALLRRIAIELTDDLEGVPADMWDPNTVSTVMAILKLDHHWWRIEREITS